MPTDIASDDIVATRADAADGSREPLVVVDTLCAFLDEHGIGSGEPQFTAIGDGHSNVTLAVIRGDARFVLRRPPRGPLPPSAHDVLREARVIGALRGRARVPEILAVCDDDAIIGAPFYVMAMVDGHVVTDSVPDVLASDRERERIGFDLVDALVEIHAVDYVEAGLEGFGKPTGYLERQLRRFLGLWEHNKTRDLEQVESVAQWLQQNLPESGPATIVHGDFRLGNVIFAPEPPATVAAVLDWEMCTIGDPLADLGYFSTLWTDRDDPDLGMFELGAVTRQPGFPTRAELIARYEEKSGRTMRDITWYQTLALWKSIVFMEGNYKRAISGASDDPFLKQFGDGVIELAKRAESLTRE